MKLILVILSASVVSIIMAQSPSSSPSPSRRPSSSTTASSAPASSSRPADVLAGLAAGHSRLILSDARLAELKKLAQTDRVLMRYVEQAIATADGYLDAKPIERKLTGYHMLNVSRECLRRAYALGLAWRWTGEARYAKALKENLLTVCGFSDWHPQHFLDTAEMTHGVAIGYDWLYSYLDEDTRATVRRKIVELGLKPGLAAYRKPEWWIASPYNWNQVCNSGLSIGALAIADEEAEIARAILSAAVANLPKAIASYDPDGAWGEGPEYWGYATIYTVYGLEAFRTALGTDMRLGDTKGLRLAGEFPLYCAGPTGMFVNYADSRERSSLRPAPALFWLARRYQNPSLAVAQHRLLADKKADPLDVIWYAPADGAKAAKLDLDRKFGGKVELALFRSAWGDPDALFASIKAGYNEVNHGHLDLGNFELDALGQRWARDLGSDDYNLPGYWEHQPEGRRWTYYRAVSSSHNVITLNGTEQAVKAKAKMTGFAAGGDRPFAIVDVAGAYGKLASRVRRGLAMLSDRRAVLVQDELTLGEAADVMWGMTTDAQIETDGAVATLKLADRKLVARILAPSGASFSIQSAERKAPQKPNKDVRRLVIDLKKQSGDVRIAVLFSPVWPDGDHVKSADVQPLEKWGK